MQLRKHKRNLKAVQAAALFLRHIIVNFFTNFNLFGISFLFLFPVLFKPSDFNPSVDRFCLILYRLWGVLLLIDYRKRIRDLREDSDLTQQDVADYLGTSQTMYARYERGANELPVRHVIKLCELHHVSADYLLGLTDEDKKKPNREE